MMLATNRQALFVGVMMVFTFALATYLKPTKKLSDSMPTVNLEKMIPAKFGEWHQDSVVLEQIVSPEKKDLLAKIYGQTLTRAYLDSQGTRVMLSIAYGGDQSDEMQVHHPEICYTAQGFQVERDRLDTLKTSFGSLPIKRLFAVQGNRNEPITYWITVGDKAVVLKGLQQKLAQLRYGLTGRVPDGLIVRVSSINADDKEAYRLQDNFIQAMLASMSKEDRVRVTGRFEG
jgi:EpsI family protein